MSEPTNILDYKIKYIDEILSTKELNQIRLIMLHSIIEFRDTKPDKFSLTIMDEYRLQVAEIKRRRLPDVR